MGSGKAPIFNCDFVQGLAAVCNLLFNAGRHKPVLGKVELPILGLLYNLSLYQGVQSIRLIITPLEQPLHHTAGSESQFINRLGIFAVGSAITPENLYYLADSPF